MKNDNDQRFKIAADAIMASSRGSIFALAGDASYCAPLSEKTCLDAGVGVTAGVKSVTREGIHVVTDSYIHREQSETFTVPYLRLGYFWSPRNTFRIGVLARMGYAFASGEYNQDKNTYLGTKSEHFSYRHSGLSWGAGIAAEGDIYKDMGMGVGLSMGIWMGAVNYPSYPIPGLESDSKRVGFEGRYGLRLGF